MILELIEQHNGYEGFLPPQANGLMESTRSAPKLRFAKSPGK